MKQVLTLLKICFFTQIAVAQSTKYSVLSNSQNQTVIDIAVGKIEQKKVVTPNGDEVKIIIDKGTQLLSKGNPDLPKLAFSILIPNQKNSSVTILESQYIDYPNIYIAPSKGTFTRDINPSTVPFIYGNAYQKDEFFPSSNAQLNQPFILRDFRGQTVTINPVQYNPATKTMRVYSHFKIKIDYFGTSTDNIIASADFPEKVVDEFDGIYKNHFVNYEKTGTRYTPSIQQGSLLVLCPSIYLNELAPFVKWKEQKGIKTYLVNVDTITGGVFETNIKNTAKWYFQNTQIAYMLIVGDNVNIPPVTSSFVKGPSDNGYAYINGNDHYPDFIVGRFSGESVEDIKTQVSRTLQYEQTPNISSNWMQSQMGVASEQGPGDDGQFDWEHIHDIVDSNKNQYNYLNNIEQYDGTNAQAGTDVPGNPDADMFKNGVNGGVSLINYCGHGSTDGLNTTTFSSVNVPSLTNTNQLPFMLTVGCRPGNFTLNTCFAEVLQRAVTNAEARGTIACFMSTIDQYWDEPMQAQDEFNAILRGARASNLKQRLGAICMDACMSMNDQYNTVTDPLGGSDMTDTWVFFGDPTVSLFTKNQGTITLSNLHPIQQNSTTYQLNCNVDGATVGLFYKGAYLSSDVVSGGVANFTFPAATSLDTVFITATKQNYLPTSTYVMVVNWPTNVNDVENVKNIDLYPNPAQDILNIRLTDNQTLENLTIIDALGKSIVSQNYNGHSVTISTKNITPGVYRVLIKTNKGEFAKCFTKQ